MQSRTENIQKSGHKLILFLNRAVQDLHSFVLTKSMSHHLPWFKLCFWWKPHICQLLTCKKDHQQTMYKYQIVFALGQSPTCLFRSSRTFIKETPNQMFIWFQETKFFRFAKTEGKVQQTQEDILPEWHVRLPQTHKKDTISSGIKEEFSWRNQEFL